VQLITVIALCSRWNF